MFQIDTVLHYNFRIHGVVFIDDHLVDAGRVIENINELLTIGDRRLNDDFFVAVEIQQDFGIVVVRFSDAWTFVGVVMFGQALTRSEFRLTSTTRVEPIHLHGMLHEQLFIGEYIRAHTALDVRRVVIVDELQVVRSVNRRTQYNRFIGLQKKIEGRRDTITLIKTNFITVSILNAIRKSSLEYILVTFRTLLKKIEVETQWFCKDKDV